MVLDVECLFLLFVPLLVVYCSFLYDLLSVFCVFFFFFFFLLLLLLLLLLYGMHITCLGLQVARKSIRRDNGFWD